MTKMTKMTKNEKNDWTNLEWLSDLMIQIDLKWPKMTWDDLKWLRMN